MNAAQITGRIQPVVRRVASRTSRSSSAPATMSTVDRLPWRSRNASKPPEGTGSTG